ncbi:MAG: hypothetical protein LH471_03765 [Salinibacterium sp.]|nr:hypothetical protein [Salinibacterium sp.]
MALRLATWSARRVLAFWGAGLVLEAVLLLVLSVVLVRPEPPLVALLRGETGGRRSIAILSSEFRPGDSAELRAGTVPPTAVEDSFYTILHWPLDKPLTAGGGRVVAVPMRLWWVPALYIFGVPLLLVGLTGAWLWARWSDA